MYYMRLLEIITTIGKHRLVHARDLRATQSAKGPQVGYQESKGIIKCMRERVGYANRKIWEREKEFRKDARSSSEIQWTFNKRKVLPFACVIVSCWSGNAKICTFMYSNTFYDVWVALQYSYSVT